MVTEIASKLSKEKRFSRLFFIRCLVTDPIVQQVNDLALTTSYFKLSRRQEHQRSMREELSFRGTVNFIS
jgi:hypothetical protein